MVFSSLDGLYGERTFILHKHFINMLYTCQKRAQMRTVLDKFA